MAEQVHAQPQPSKKVDAAEAVQMAEQDAEVQAAQAKGQPDMTELDEFLDEIDRLLEDVTVATEYRQRGGE